MVLAGNTLFIAGPAGNAATSLNAFEGKKGVRLAAVSTSDGKILAYYKLDSLAVFDGLAAAQGCLFLATTDGKVHCFGPAKGEPLQSVEVDSIEETKPIPPVETPLSAPPRLTSDSRDKDFAAVVGGKVLASDLGYRLAADKGQVALSVKKLEKPLTKKAVFRLKLRTAPGFTHPPFYENGFLAFGDGTADASLVKCGLLLVQKTALIIPGPMSAKKGGRKLDHASQPLTLEVAVTFDSRKVTMQVAGETIEAILDRPLNSITHLGYCVQNAVTDFSHIESVGE
jgi:hypothetical protein